MALQFGSRRVRLASALAIAALVSAVGSAALAQTAASSAPGSAEEDLIGRGVDLRRQGRDADALELFRQAYELHHDARARAQMALAELALGQWVLADRHLREALTDTHAPWIQTNRAVLNQTLQRVGQHVGSLRVTGGVPGAQVYVNGEQVATLPMSEPVRVLAGEFPMEVRAPGHHTVVLPIEVRPDSLTQQSVRLVPLEPGEENSGAPSGGVAVAPNPSSPAPPSTQPSASRPIYPYVLLGAGAVGLILGGAFLGLQFNATGQLDTMCTLGTPSQPGCPPSAAGLIGDAHTFNAAMITSFVIGGAALVAGGVTWYLTRPAAHERVTVRAAVFPGGAMVGVGGSL